MSKARTLANTVSTGGSLETPDAIPASDISGLSTVATSGSYNDLSSKPTLSTVATSGSYNDLSNKPTTIETANDLSGGVTGSIPYQAGVGDTSMLSPGTSGQVLTSGGSGSLPTWATVSAGFTLATPLATTSGTSKEFTGIPSGTKMVVVSFNTVSLNSSGVDMPIRVKLGTSSAYETSGFSGYSLGLQSGSFLNSYSFTANIVPFAQGSSQGRTFSGQLILSLLDATNDIWSYQSNVGTGSDVIFVGGGTADLSGPLYKLKIEPDAGSFDSGSVNIMYM